MQICVSIRRREELRDTTGDPWNGRTLEWSTSSPPPAYNFAFTPIVHDIDAWWDMKQRGYHRPLERLQADPHAEEHADRHHPRRALRQHSAFGMIWYIWWLAALSFAAVLAAAIAHTFNYNRDYDIPADEVARTEGERTRLLRRTGWRDGDIALPAREPQAHAAGATPIFYLVDEHRMPRATAPCSASGST